MTAIPAAPPSGLDVTRLAPPPVALLPWAVMQVPPEPLPEPVPAVMPAQLRPDPAPGVRVELGFRDGSTAALSPDSEQAKALSDIASVLTRKD